MLMDDTHVVHHPSKESADRPGITRSRPGTPILHVTCLVHQACEVTPEVAKRRHVGFHGPHDCRTSWMDRLIVGDALSRSNGPVRCADETEFRRQGHSWCPVSTPAVGRGHFVRPQRDPMVPRLPPCGATRSGPHGIWPLGVGVAETRPLFVRFGPQGAEAWLVIMCASKAHVPLPPRGRVTGGPHVGSFAQTGPLFEPIQAQGPPSGLGDRCCPPTFLKVPRWREVAAPSWSPPVGFSARASGHPRRRPGRPPCRGSGPSRSP